MTLPATNALGVPTVLDPFSGELVELDDPQVMAELVENLRVSKLQIDKVIDAVTMIAETIFEREGTKTLNVGPWVLTLKTPDRLEWDHEELEKLLDVGLSEERYSQLVKETVTRKVDQGVARQLEAANDDYAAIIRQARTRTPLKHSLEVKPA